MRNGFIRLACLFSVVFGAAIAQAEVKTKALSGGGVQISVPLSHAVPHRVFARRDPAQLVLDFDGHDPSDWALSDRTLDQVVGMRAGWFAQGWSRIVLDFSEPLSVQSVELKTDTPLALLVKLSPQDTAKLSPPPAWHMSAQSAPVRARPEGLVRVVLDPGHGGIDPGAIREGIAEKDIALNFAYELRYALSDTGRYDVVMTRDADIFVPLRERVAKAQSAQGHVFLSLHANTVTRGNASGAAVYSLSEEASDSEAAALASLENRADLMAGLDLSGQETDLALTLLELAQRETNARSKVFAASLVSGLRNSVGVIRNNPHRSAGFRVLKAPEIPSLLLELGFLSDPNDRARMLSPVWRALAIEGIIDALDDWVERDRVMAELARR